MNDWNNHYFRQFLIEKTHHPYPRMEAKYTEKADIA